MSTETLEAPAKSKATKNPAVTPPSLPQGIINIDALQAYVDGIQKDMVLPTVSLGNGVYAPLEHYTEKDGTAKSRQVRVCDLDKDGEVVPLSGVVVPDEYGNHILDYLLSKIAQKVHHAAAAMAKSHGENSGVVERRTRVLPAIRSDEW